MKRWPSYSMSVTYVDISYNQVCSVVWWGEKGKAEVRNGKGIALGV